MSSILDVAKKAKVSPATVSNVFNKPERVKLKTKETVLRVAKELNFQPNPFARGLRQQKTGMIAIAVSDIAFPHSAQLVKGAQERLRKAHRLGLITNTGYDNKKIRDIFLSLDAQGMSGFIVSAVPDRYDDKTLSLLGSMQEKGTPVVYVGNTYESVNADVVLNQSQQGFKSMVQYLAKLGHKRIAYLSFYHSKGIAVKRWLGFQEGILAAGLTPTPNFIIEGDMTMQAGVDGLEKLWRLKEKPTAIVTPSDMIALGVMNAAHRMGIKIPDDLSVTAADTLAISEYGTPSLSTVSIPSYELGVKSAELLLQRIEKPDLPYQKVSLPYQLICRESTAPPRKDA